MAQPNQDHRSTRRFALQLPVTVRFPEPEARDVDARTKDVSARGVFFYLETPLAEGTSLDFTLTLPPEIILTDSIRVRCKGKVVRVEPNAGDGRVGIAAVIEQYEFLSEG